MNRTLYIGNRNASSWALRAWLAVREMGIDFEEVLVDIRRPQRWDNLKSIGEFSPPAAVPVLNDDGFIIWDSLAIMEYANEIGDGSLLPSDPKQRAKARSFAAWQHSTFSRICPSLSFESAFYPNKKTLTADEREDILWIYGVWEASLNEFGGEYLVGHYSLADIMLLPSVVRFSAHLAPDGQFPLTREWVGRLLARPFVAEWMDEAVLLEPIFLPGYRDAG